MAQQTQINVSEVPPAEWQRDLGKDLQEQSDYRIRAISVRGAFFFGTTTRMQSKINRLIGAQVVIINCLQVPFMDISAAFALSEMVDKLKAAGIKPILVIAEGVGIDRLLSGLGCSDIFGSDGIQVDFNTSVQLARDYLLQLMPSSPRPTDPAAAS
jgi:SulP family sulfate permease